MATTVVSWIVTSAIDAFHEAQNELNKPISPRATPRAISRPYGKATNTTDLKFPPVAPEIQHLIISFVPPSKLWTQFRRVSRSYKLTIEEILAPRWLKEGHLSLYLQFNDVSMKDFKGMLFNGMTYGPDLKGPYCLEKMKSWNDERPKSLQFNVNRSSLETRQDGKVHFDFYCPHGRDARRDKLSQKLGYMPGNTVAVSFAPYVPNRSVEAIACEQMQFSMQPPSHAVSSLPPRLSLSPSESKAMREGIQWDTMSVELDYFQLLGVYFKEAERNETKEAAQRVSPSAGGSSMLSWASWYTSS